MRLRLLLLTLAVGISLLCQARAKAQGFPWNDFERRTMAQLIKMNVEDDAEDLKRFPQSGQMVMRGKILPSIIRLIYTGESRKISEVRSKFIETWGKFYSQDKDYNELFEAEFRFKEGPDEYWLPVQKPVTKYFDKELTKDGPVDLYLVRPGGIRSKDRIDWIFLVEEFQKVQQ